MPDDANSEKLGLEIEILRARWPLERSKLLLEIEGLQKGFLRTLTTSVITAVVAVAIAVGGWTVDHSKTREAAADAQAKSRDEVFARVLEQFGDPNPAMRMAATVALTTFARQKGDFGDQVVAALVNRLSTADEIPELEQVIWALEHVGRSALPEVVSANQRAVMAFARSCGRYAGMPNESAITTRFWSALDRGLMAAEAPFDDRYTQAYYTPFSQSAVFLEPAFRAPFQAELSIWKPKKKANELPIQPGDAKALRSSVLQKWLHLQATSVAITRILRGISGAANGADLTGVVILNGDLRNLDLRGVILRKATIVERNLENTNLACADLTYAHLGSTYFDNTNMRGAKLDGAELRYWDYDASLDGFGIADLLGSNWNKARWVSRDNKEEKYDQSSKPPGWVMPKLAKSEAASPFSTKECGK